MNTTDGHDIAAHLTQVPHAVALGIRLISQSDTHCELALPYAEHLVGDPDSAVLHGGAITALLDNAAGLVAYHRDRTHMEAAVATLDMRIDYLAAARPGLEVRVRAECYKRTRNIVFVRARAFHDDVDDPIAVCSATFMVGTPNAPRAERPA